MKTPVISPVLLALCLVASQPAARAATYTWTGAGVNGDWQTAGNFSPGGTITNGDSLIFDGNNYLTTNSNNLDVYAIDSITFNAGAGAFTLTGDGLGPGAGITNLSSNLQTISLYQLGVNVSSQTWDAGTGGLRITAPVLFNVLADSVALTVTGSGNTSIEGQITEFAPLPGTHGSIIKAGTGTLTLTGANSYTGGTTVNGGLINFATANNFGTGKVTLDGGGLQWAAGSSVDISNRLNALGGSGGIFDTNGNAVILASALSGVGGLAKSGAGVLTLTGSNSYAGGTMVNSGTLVVAGTGASINHNSGTMTVGSVSGDNGTLITGTGALVSSASGVIGAAAGSQGSVRVSSGTWTTSGILTVGNSGAGSLLVNTGLVTSGSGVIGRFAGSSGTATVSSGTWSNTGDIYVGQAGRGGLVISGGLVNDNIGAISTGTATGVATVSGGTWNNTSRLLIGAVGSGTLNLTGGVIAADFSIIGNNVGSKGWAEVSGGVWSSTLSGLTVGALGTGSLRITDGLVRSTYVQVGVAATASGTLQLNGGVLETGMVLKGNGAASFSFSGGTLRATGNEADFVSGFAPGVTINSGGAFVDSNGFAVGIGTALSGTGVLIKQGGGPADAHGSQQL